MWCCCFAIYYLAKMCQCMNNFKQSTFFLLCYFDKSETYLISEDRFQFFPQGTWHFLSDSFPLDRCLSCSAQHIFAFEWGHIQCGTIIPHREKLSRCDQRSEWQSFLNYHQDTFSHIYILFSPMLSHDMAHFDDSLSGHANIIPQQSVPAWRKQVLPGAWEMFMG